MRELHEVEWGSYNRDSMQDILGRLVAAIVQNKKNTASLQRDWERVLQFFDLEKNGVEPGDMIADVVTVLTEASKGRVLSVWDQVLCPMSRVPVRHYRLDMVRVMKLFSQIQYFLSKTNDARYSAEAQAVAKGDAIVSATQAGLYLDQAMYFPRK